MAKMSYKGELALLSHAQAISVAIALAGIAGEVTSEKHNTFVYSSTFPKGTDIFSDFFHLFFGGSLCRKVPTSADIDLAVLVINKPAVDAFFQVLIAHYCVVPPIINGDKMKRFILQLPWVLQNRHFQLDVWLTDKPEGWPAMKMFVAGDGQLNAIQRGVANRKGFTLNQYGLWKDGVIIPCTTEQEVYNHLGMKWLDYPDRTIDKSKLARALKG